MKNLITLLLLIITSIGYSQKLTPQTKPEVFDTLHIEYIKKLVVDYVNEYRKEKGLVMIQWDERFKPAADHHQYYMRATNDFGHGQNDDFSDIIPNHKILREPNNRIQSLIPKENGRVVFEPYPSELLTQTLWTQHELSCRSRHLKLAKEKNIKIFTCEFYAMSIVETYKLSKSHFEALMDPYSHYIYVSIDIDPTSWNTKSVFPTILIFTGRESIHLDRLTLEENFDYIDNEEKFAGWFNKDIEEYYISRRVN
mgnify:FL=1